MWLGTGPAPSWVRAPNVTPALRVDVRIVPDRDDTVRVYEPSMQRFVPLSGLELYVAQHMNGQRGLDELTAIARPYHPAITRAMIEQLVVTLAVGGLVAPAAELASSEPELELDTVLLAPSADAPAAVGAAGSQGALARGSLTREAIADAVGDAEAAANAAVEVADAAEADGGVEDGPAEAPGSDGPSPEDIAAQEQEALWSEARARAWYQRRWVRVLAVLALLVGVTAVIPYPLRVNSQCSLIPSERVKVRSELAGVLIEIAVDEGQRVRRGDVIARIDDRALKADRLRVLAEIEKARAELATLKVGRRPEEIQQQEAVLAARQNEAVFGAKEARRRKQMAREGVGSRAQADEARGQAESRRRAVAEAQAALRLLKAGSRPEEIAAQQAMLKKVEAELAYIDERLAMTIVKSPIDGEILTPRFRERLNESVEAGGLVAEIANTRRMRAEIFVPEREVDAIQLGMPAEVKVESYPTRGFEGRVDFIAPSVDGADRRLRVVVELDNAAGLLKTNMTGYGEIEAGRRSLLTLATRRIVRWVRVRFLI